MELENIPTDANKKISAIFSHLITNQSNKSIGLEKVIIGKGNCLESKGTKKKKRNWYLTTQFLLLQLGATNFATPVNRDSR